MLICLPIAAFPRSHPSPIRPNVPPGEHVTTAVPEATNSLRLRKEIEQLVDKAVVVKLINPDGDFLASLVPDGLSRSARADFIAVAAASLNELHHGSFLSRKRRSENITAAVLQATANALYINPCLRPRTTAAFTCTVSGTQYVMEFNIHGSNVPLDRPFTCKRTLGPRTTPIHRPRALH